MSEDPCGFVEAAGFPCIEALRDRIQPEKWHPEGDSYVHTLLCLQRAVDLGYSLEVRFAVLVHDLGKAITPDDELPHHYNHEKLGVPLVEAFCDEMEVNSYTRALAVACCREHLNVHRYEQMKPVKRVRLISRLRRDCANHDINTFICDAARVYQCDAQGRGPDFVNKPYPQGVRLALNTLRIASCEFDEDVSRQKLEQLHASVISSSN